jgi:hypothetical protein
LLEGERLEGGGEELGDQTVMVAVDELESLVHHVLVVPMLGLHDGSFLTALG